MKLKKKIDKTIEEVQNFKEKLKKIHKTKQRPQIAKKTFKNYTTEKSTGGKQKKVDEISKKNKKKRVEIGKGAKNWD